MSDMKIVAGTRGKERVVVEKDGKYAILNKGENSKKDIHWGGKEILHSAVHKHGFVQVKDKAEKSLAVSRRKSVGRQDSTKNRKKQPLEINLDNLGLRNFEGDLTHTKVTKKSELYLDISKAGKVHLPEGAERYAYKVPSDYGIIYIPVNRLHQVYQSDKATNSKKVQENASKMKAGKELEPIEIGYNYDVHDGHHRWEASKKVGYTHVPCKVVGNDPEKVKEAKRKYREVWKSVGEEPEVLEKSPSSLALVLDLQKGGQLNRGKLVKKRVMVRGKGGKTFFRMQWVDPSEKGEHIHPHNENHTTFHHHTDGLKEMEKRQSNKFPVVHHKSHEVKNTKHNYTRDENKYKEAKQKFHSGEKLSPIKVNHKSEVMEGHHLLDLAHDLGLTHVPTIVVGDPTLKKELEDKLKEKTFLQDEDGNMEQISGGGKTGHHMKVTADSSEAKQSIEYFKKFTSKKYSKEYIMDQARQQGIKWETKKKNGASLNPEKSTDKAILWMRASTEIQRHIASGKSFQIDHNEKEVDKRMKEDGKDSLEKHFKKLLEKFDGDRDKLMEYADKNGIKWKHVSNPSINWMYAATAIKAELGKGKMVAGIRTRQKQAMEDSSVIITDAIREQVKELAKNYGKSEIMDKADKLGLEYDKFNKKGQPLADNSPVLWMRASTAIQTYIAKGNTFAIGGTSFEDNGLKSKPGDYGNYDLHKHGRLAIDIGKRNNQNFEKKANKWAIESIMLDKELDREDAEAFYEILKEKARDSKLMLHFDPTEVLPSGVTLLEQMMSDGSMKNDYLLNRGLDKEHREANERDLYGDDYDEAKDGDRPVYGTLDLYNHGLDSSPYGDVALVLKDDVKKRSTGTPIDSNSIPYGKEGKLTHALDDPHHLLVKRWTMRWKNPKNRDAQRDRAVDAVANGDTHKDDNRYFEAQIHGDVRFKEDLDHILVPASWRKGKEHADRHDQIKRFAELSGVEIKYS